MEWKGHLKSDFDSSIVLLITDCPSLYIRSGNQNLPLQGFKLSTLWLASITRPPPLLTKQAEPPPSPPCIPT
ncbi:hypothetical protein JHK87_054047 [Glycine soja]|nr:hypothetical protein JHK86_053986 [Glycine max]KAG4916490.1 hypothetical protein JHK87_054047 [Glycine soja]